MFKLIAVFISLISFDVTVDTFKSTPGKLIPFPFIIFPLDTERIEREVF